MFLLKSFISTEENGIDIQLKTFWLDNMKGLKSGDKRVKILTNEIDILIEADFLRSPDKFPVDNGLEIITQEKNNENIKDKYLTAKEEIAQSINSNSSISSSSVSSRKHRISLTPTSASNYGVSFFNNGASKILQPKKRSSKISKKMHQQLYTNSNTNESKLFHLQKSNDSKPITLLPKAIISSEKDTESFKITEASTKISTFNLEDEISKSNIENINDIIVSLTCNLTQLFI